MKHLMPYEKINQKIFLIRRHRVMYDKDLAQLYGVKTKVLIQTVKRNRERFPEDFMSCLTKDEFINLKSQFATSSWGGRRYLPYVFTEQGAAMLSSVLNSKRAIRVNIQIMRAFVKLRRIFSSNKALANKLAELEKKIEKHDQDIIEIFEAIRQLMVLPENPKKRIGFVKEPKKKYTVYN